MSLDRKDKGVAYLEHDGLLHETDMAKLYSIHDAEVWIPKSLIERADDQIVVVPGWWAEKNELESDW